MDQSTNRFGFSTISKASRLPVRQDLVKPRNVPSQYTLKNQAMPIDSVHKQTVPDSVPARTGQSNQPNLPRNGGDTEVSVERDQSDPSLRARTLPRRPRPSLSDRTMETLAQIPPSPSPRRRQSGFFPSEGLGTPSSRPASSLSRSRPSTSQGQHPPLPSGYPTPRPQSPTKRPLLPGNGNKVPSNRSSKRIVSADTPIKSPLSSKPHNEVAITPSRTRPSMKGPPVLSSNQDFSLNGKTSPYRGSKTLAARPLKARPSIHDAFVKPASEAKKPPFTQSRQARDSIKESMTPSNPTPASVASSSVSPKVPASSAALRETIAKAKAARRGKDKSLGVQAARPVQAIDKFPDIEVGQYNEELLRSRVGKARTDGRLNIAALGLKEMPQEVLSMYSSNVGQGAWYESVDLIRLVAADNEFKAFDEKVFPDTKLGSTTGDNDCEENMFGGLEALDLHNNHLNCIPTGLRRLERLTSLNLSKNNLGNDCLRITCQISTLRELRLDSNNLKGTLSSELCGLTNLEVLDLHDNALNALSEDLQGMSSLRVLNLAGNQLTSLPFDSLESLPLAELNVARNRLSGSLFPANLNGLPYLRSLDIANNALTSITDNSLIHLPALQDLNVAQNRLIALPDVAGWPQLITLTAGGNKLVSFPEGIDSLQKIRTIDYSQNDLRAIDERLGLIESLVVLRVASNPLRERKFLTMETGEIKRELRSRSQPIVTMEEALDPASRYKKSDPTLPASNTWPMKPGGILDRSSTKLDTIDPSDFKSLTENNDVKTMILHHNLFPHIPPAILFASHTLVSLDISHNKLASAKYLFAELSLPNLQSLDASVNTIASLTPLLEYLSAPKLTEINLSRNRLTSLPPLKEVFRSLTTFNASDNKISKLPVESVRGLNILDVSGNDINSLEPKLGLLEAEGLRTLVLGGNTFKVPRRDTIEKGTVAVLAWLRNRIPEDEVNGLG